MNIKTLLSIASVGITAAAFFGGSKLKELASLGDQIHFKITGLKNISYSNGQVHFDVDIEIINPTSIAIDVPGESLTLTALHFFSQSGKYLAVANPNVVDIALPAKASRTITNIPVKVSLTTIGNSFNEVLDLMENPDSLRITAEMEAFGQSFTINTP